MAIATAVDPITLAVVHNALTTAAREMRDTIQRTSFAPVIYEDRDFACGLLDADGATLAEAPGLTAFMGTLSPCWRRCLETIDRSELAAGDVVIVALPDYTGSHPADMALFAPIFHGDRIFGFTASKAHLIDVGAKDPYPTDSTDAFQEGLRLPPVKLYRRGVLNEEIGGIIRVNSRAPEVIWGDIHAQIAAFRVGERACQRLLDKYGFEVVTGCIAEMYDHAERMARAAIRTMPAGTWSAEDHLDDNGVERGKPVPVKVSVTIDPEAAEITFDYTGSAAQQVGPTNAPVVGTISISRMMGKILTTPVAPANEGSFRPIKVIAPAGSIFNAGSTAPTNLYGWPEMNAVEAVIKALGGVFPDKLPAGSGGDLCGVLRYGFYPDTGKMWYEANIDGVGQGASAIADGESAMVHISEACSRNLPVEIEETKDPVIVERYELIADSGGPGRFRGGLGVRRDYRLHAPARIISVLERCTSPHWGVAGGRPGARNYGVLESSIHGQVEITKTPDMPMADGDLISIRTGGGGGYGDPFERDPEAVRRDVIDGYVSIEAARGEYGVAIEPGSFATDQEATTEMRAARQADRMATT
jgi:N-methylhydantoinase B